VPDMPCEALRAAFVDHGRAMGVSLETVDRTIPLTEVSAKHIIVLLSWFPVTAGLYWCALLSC